MRERFGHLMWDFGGLRLVGWVVLMSFLPVFKDMELEHHIVIGIFWFNNF